jgi:restriction system protein
MPIPDFQSVMLPLLRVSATRPNEEISTREAIESLTNEFQKIRDELVSQLLERIRQYPLAFCERLVVELLVKMGYGGSRSDAGRAIGRTSDERIDGIIKEDKL